MRGTWGDQVGQRKEDERYEQSDLSYHNLGARAHRSSWGGLLGKPYREPNAANECVYLAR